jgi:hypothetical protein
MKHLHICEKQVFTSEYDICTAFAETCSFHEACDLLSASSSVSSGISLAVLDLGTKW